MMEKSTESLLKRKVNAFLLWGYGWKRRKCPHHRSSLQWRDPYSGLWYHEDAAMQLLMADARDQILNSRPDAYRNTQSGFLA